MSLLTSYKQNYLHSSLSGLQEKRNKSIHCAWKFNIAPWNESQYDTIDFKAKSDINQCITRFYELPIC